MVAEETKDRILLFASTSAPVEIYSGARLAEFYRSNDEALILHTREGTGSRYSQRK